MFKIKKTIDGKEVEIEITDAEAKALGLVSQTSLLEDDDIFEEAAEMRGFKGKKAGSEINSIAKKVNELTKIVEAQNSIIEKLSTDKQNAANEIKSIVERQQEESVKTLLAEAVKTGKISASKEDAEKWTARFKKDFDLAKETLSELPVNPALNKNPGKKEGEEGGKEENSNKSGNPILNRIAEMNSTAAIQTN